MNAIERLRAAKEAAINHIQDIIGTVEVAPDRKEELMKLSKGELADMVISLDKTKAKKPFTVEQIAQAILEDTTCSLLPLKGIAALMQANVPECATTEKGLRSYTSRHKDDWNIVPREKLDLTADI